MMWLARVGAVTVVVLLYWVLLDFVLDRFGPPPGKWPGTPDGRTA